MIPKWQLTGYSVLMIDINNQQQLNTQAQNFKKMIVNFKEFSFSLTLLSKEYHKHCFQVFITISPYDLCILSIGTETA